VSELYYPEDTSTGYYVTGIAEGLAADEAVAVLCSQPTYAARGTRAPSHERRKGVEIWRCAGTTLDKDRLLSRCVNLTTISLSIFGNALRRFRQGDVVVVTTNPPTLPFVAVISARLRGTRCVLLVHDVYPEVLVASGLFSERSTAVRLLAALQRVLYHWMDKIVVIGRDMELLVARRAAVADSKTARIPNWADLDDVRPTARDANPLIAQLGLAEKFIVQYSGNMGRTHGLESVIAAAERLRGNGEIHLLLIGGGAKKSWLEHAVVDRRLTNVTILPYQPRSAIGVSLNACDIALISFAPGMAGVSVPSRMYNVMAAGKPIVAVADPQSELAQLVREERIGWVTPPGDAERIASTIAEASSDRAALAEMGTRARAAAERKYSYNRVISAYRSVVSELLAPDPQRPHSRERV
jgi:glycosyltransferase involved in cell wall biosynthesis